MHERRWQSVAATIACLVIGSILWVDSSAGQAPGRKSEEKKAPATRGEKLHEQQDAFKDAIDWSQVNLEPGPVDQKLDTFLKKLGYAGEPFVESKESKKKYMLSIGQQTMSADIKPGWMQRRIIALNQAELEARAEMAKTFKRALSSGQLFEQFDGLSPQVVRQLKELKKSADAGAVSADAYEEITNRFVSAQVIGAYTVKTIEGMSGDQFKVVRVMLWSPQLYDLALNVLADADYFLPSEKVKPDEIDEISLKPEELLPEVGTKVYFNKEGQRYYVSYGQAEPIAQSQREVARAKKVAEDFAELQAEGYLARTLAANITGASMGGLSLTYEKMGKDQDAEKMTRSFYQRMESQSKDLKITGAITYHKRTYLHPEWKVPVSVAVVVWTPKGRQTVKELGLDKSIDIHSPEALLGYLTKKYGAPASAKPLGSGVTGKKPATQESKDPKKIP